METTETETETTGAGPLLTADVDPSEMMPGDRLVAAAASVRAYRDALAAQFVEREDVADALVTSAIAEQHAVLLGPPGTAKSAIVRALAGGLGWSTFVRLVARTTTPDELWGPWSLSALEAGRYERVVHGYLPTAEMAFIDEIFKANSAILNGLLTVLNERVYDHGSEQRPAALRMLVAASNEHPETDGELAAMYDRLLVRVYVPPVSTDAAFVAMLAGPETDDVPFVPPWAIDTLTTMRRDVDVSAVVPGLLAIRKALSAEEAKPRIQASDRRWKQALSLIQAAAVLDGRMAAKPSDLRVLRHVLWSDPGQRSAVALAVADHAHPVLTALRRMVSEATERARSTAPDPANATANITALAEARKVAGIVAEAVKLAAASATDEDVLTALDQMRDVAADVLSRVVAIDPGMETVFAKALDGRKSRASRKPAAV